MLAEEGDDYFVFLLSDANLDRWIDRAPNCSQKKPKLIASLIRYGLSAKEAAKHISSAAERNVNSYVIFIASLDDEADQWKRDLPVGRGYVCLDTTKLPYIFKQIFTTNLMH